MPRPRYPFDPQAAQQLLSYIRSGGYPLVAAEGAGVAREVYLHWLRRGQHPHAREPFRGFVRQVRQAMAQARLMAELAVFDKDSKYWLGHGPGKETPDNPGWTTEGKSIAKAEEAPAEPDCPTLVQLFLQALSDFPEVRLVVARRLREKIPLKSIRFRRDR
jgi:hypothetical protein